MASLQSSSSSSSSSSQESASKQMGFSSFEAPPEQYKKTWHDLQFKNTSAACIETFIREVFKCHGVSPVQIIEFLLRTNILLRNLVLGNTVIPHEYCEEIRETILKDHPDFNVGDLDKWTGSCKSWTDKFDKLDEGTKDSRLSKALQTLSENNTSFLMMAACPSFQDQHARVIAVSAFSKDTALTKSSSSKAPIIGILLQHQTIQTRLARYVTAKLTHLIEPVYPSAAKSVLARYNQLIQDRDKVAEFQVRFFNHVSFSAEMDILRHAFTVVAETKTTTDTSATAIMAEILKTRWSNLNDIEHYLHDLYLLEEKYMFEKTGKKGRLPPREFFDAVEVIATGSNPLFASIIADVKNTDSLKSIMDSNDSLTRHILLKVQLSLAPSVPADVAEVGGAYQGGPRPTCEHCTRIGRNPNHPTDKCFVLHPELKFKPAVCRNCNKPGHKIKDCFLPGGGAAKRKRDTGATEVKKNAAIVQAINSLSAEDQKKLPDSLAKAIASKKRFKKSKK